MQNNEITGFTNAINVMREVWGLQALSTIAAQAYWDRLNQFTQAQFTKACRKLMDKSAGDFKRGFPLPGDFLEAMSPEVEEYKTKWPDEVPPGPTSRIIKRILTLMPARGKFNTDAEANSMVPKMNQIVDEEFAGQDKIPF